MKTILALLFSALVAIGAPGDFLFTKIGTPNTPVLLTPVNGRVLHWNGTTIGNLDIAGTYAPLASPTFTGTVNTGNLTTGGLLTFGTGTTFAFATGLDTGFRSALGLGALSTVTPGTGVAAALAINTGSTGAVALQGGAISATTVTAAASGTVANFTDSSSGRVWRFSSGNLSPLGNNQANLGASGARIATGYFVGLDTTNVTASGAVTATGKISASVPAYANDAAADADATLLSGQFYKITGSRTVYQKP